MLRIYAETLDRLRVRLNMYLVIHNFIFGLGLGLEILEADIEADIQ